MRELTLFPPLSELGNVAPLRFNGSDYEPERDDVRLTGQILRVFECMRDNKWRTLSEIESETGDPQASISAQLRHLRKARFGSHTVEKEHLGNGLYRYRLTVNGRRGLPSR